MHPCHLSTRESSGRSSSPSHTRWRASFANPAPKQRQPQDTESVHVCGRSAAATPASDRDARGEQEEMRTGDGDGGSRREGKWEIEVE